MMCKSQCFHGFNAPSQIKCMNAYQTSWQFLTLFHHTYITFRYVRTVNQPPHSLLRLILEINCVQNLVFCKQDLDVNKWQKIHSSSNSGGFYHLKNTHLDSKSKHFCLFVPLIFRQEISVSHRTRHWYSVHFPLLSYTACHLWWYTVQRYGESCNSSKKPKPNKQNTRTSQF